MPIYQFGVKGKRGFNCVAILPIKTNESSCVKSFARQALPVLSVNAKYIGCLQYVKVFMVGWKSIFTKCSRVKQIAGTL